MRNDIAAVALALSLLSCAHSATLAWEPADPEPENPAVSEPARYRVYRQSDASGPFHVVAEVPASELHATITGLLNDHVYTFYVTAVDEVGNESEPSERLIYKSSTTK
jgi:fibronectin type 3 domain-containing protein